MSSLMLANLTQQQIMMLMAQQQATTLSVYQPVWVTGTATCSSIYQTIATSGTNITTTGPSCYINASGGSGGGDNEDWWQYRADVRGSLRLGQTANIGLPDGSRLVLNDDGSYEVKDQAQKIIYKASPIRAFNSFVNASDKLEAFIKWAGSLDLTQDELLNLPVNAFIMWLITEAALHDGHPEEADAQQLRLTIQPYRLPRCGYCGRFVSRRNAVQGMHYCNGLHYDKAMAKAQQRRLSA